MKATRAEPGVAAAAHKRDRLGTTRSRDGASNPGSNAGTGTRDGRDQNKTRGSRRPRLSGSRGQRLRSEWRRLTSLSGPFIYASLTAFTANQRSHVVPASRNPSVARRAPPDDVDVIEAQPPQFIRRRLAGPEGVPHSLDFVQRHPLGPEGPFPYDSPGHVEHNAYFSVTAIQTLQRVPPGLFRHMTRIEDDVTPLLQRPAFSRFVDMPYHRLMFGIPESDAQPPSDVIRADDGDVVAEPGESRAKRRFARVRRPAKDHE